MLKYLARIFTLLIALLLLGSGGYYIYNKQKSEISHWSFHYADAEGVININSLTKIKDKAGFEPMLRQFGVSQNAVDLIVECSKQLSTVNTTSCQLSFKNDIFLISFKNAIKKELEDLLKGNLSQKDGQIKYKKGLLNYKIVSDFIVFSNGIIQVKSSDSEIEFQGNRDFVYINKLGINKTYKLVDDFIFSSLIENGNLKGDPIDPMRVLSSCPTSADSIIVYGSTRFLDDLNYLLSSDSIGFYKWVDDAMAYIVKDSFELVVGMQNDISQLKTFLEEQTLKKSEDSLLPNKIYLNNFEIMPFKYTDNWKSILPNMKTGFNYYSEYDNQIFLANSLPAMYWLIREIQLGKTFNSKTLKFKLTSKLNKVVLAKHQNVWNTIIDTRINKNTSLQLSANQGSEIIRSQSTVEIEGFSYLKEASKLKLINFTNQTKLLIKGSNTIDLHNFKGDKIWSINSSEKINELKIAVDIDNNGIQNIVYSSNNQLHVIDSNGVEITGFPFVSTSSINTFKVLKYDNSKVRILINSENTIFNIDANGKIILGWTKPKQIGEIKGQISYNVLNGYDYIFGVSDKDSLVVLNRKGELRFGRSNLIQIKNLSNYLIGDIQLASARLLGYDENKIYTQNLKSGLIDSTILGSVGNSNKHFWLKQNNQIQLGLESDKKVVLYSQYGIIENEILKPEFGTSLIFQKSIINGMYIFFNSQSNKLYLLGSYGNLLYDVPFQGSSMIDYDGKILVTLVDKRVILYQLNR